MSDYVAWHKRMRQAFPGELLFSRPNVPKLLICMCSPHVENGTINGEHRLCGGLHDRLEKLLWDMFLANQTKRLLLIHWCTPAPLQTFLEPNELDWTMLPEQVLFLNINSTSNSISFPNYNNSIDSFAEKLERIHHMFRHGKEKHGTNKFWKDGYQEGLKLAKTGEHQHIKIMRQEMLGSEIVLKQELEALGETDTVDWTPAFDRLFWAFFRPMQVVLQELESTMNELHLNCGKYSAVHCRVRRREPKQYGPKMGIHVEPMKWACSGMATVENPMRLPWQIARLPVVRRSCKVTSSPCTFLPTWRILFDI
jgi:hypothetical protein